MSNEMLKRSINPNLLVKSLTANKVHNLGKIFRVVVMDIFILSLVITLPQTILAFSGSGSGTEADPYIITNVNQIQEMKDDLSAWYELANDIDASATSGWNGGDGFLPVGVYGNRFTGTFDGNNHTITDLYINTSANYSGMFGFTHTTSVVKNVGLIDVNVTGRARLGGLIGYAFGIVTNCYSTGSVTSTPNSMQDIGGLIGETHATVTKCYSTANVTAGNEVLSVGGFVGSNWATITNCYSTGNVSIGYVWTGYGVGGFSGRNYTSATMTNCYSTGHISGSAAGGVIGGFVGVGGGTYNDDFWDTQTSGYSTSDGGTGKTTAEMKTLATFTDETTVGLTTAWDFYSNPYDDVANNDYWDMDLSGIRNSGYPFLSWEYPTHSLPVELSTFTAQYLNNSATLYWETQSETNNMGWFVYRNGEEDFATSEKVSEFIDGYGTTTQTQDYIYEDAEQLQVEQTYYYWLESVDYSGTLHHFDMVAQVTIPHTNEPGQNITPPLAYEISADPNPFSYTTNISFVMNQTSMVDVVIYNVKGQLVKTFNPVMTSQENETVTFSWNGKDDTGRSLSNGVYLYSVKVNGKDYATKQVILMK